MAQTPRATEAPAAAAGRKVADLAREMAGDLAEGYRKSTRYARMKAAIAASWLALSTLAIVAACPASGPTNALGAVVKMLPGNESLMGTQLLVTNESGENWTDVVFTLDDGWTHEKKTVRSGDRVVLSLRQFRREGASPPEDLKPRSLRIECGQGKATEPLVPR